ncbi:nucleolar protein 11 [Biomphalaria glabrata]|uniref:Nucleolar protein 11-like n=1 Tax=Biomphalaria glabrata TaxID=6526 RepID=A0A2C9M3I5_BIOGL|nr:nucleolar protein 11-like [Biomphalaria glabrata]KAI8794914.1 nucleolar protein 11 [Biomphalaria glabrata]
MMAVNDKAIVERCIEEQDLSRLLKLPDVLDDFSEASLVKSLQWILRVDEKLIDDATKEITSAEIKKRLSWSDENTEAPFSDRKCYVINLMLCQKFTPQFLQEEARSLSFDAVLTLTKYIQFLLCWLPVLEKPNRFVPSYEQIIDWLNVFVDSHFQQLKLSEDAAAVVNSLYDQVVVMAKWQLDSRMLYGTLAELNRQFEEKQRNVKMGDYCIEVISF